MTMNSGGVIAAMMTITILAALLAALIAAFLTWLATKKTATAILAGGGAFLAVTGLMIEIFTNVGPLNQ